MRVKTLIFLLFVILVCIFGCSRPNFLDRYIEEELKPFEWVQSTPEAQGLDPSIFENAYQKALELPFLDSLLVVKNGFLIAEKYYNGYTKDHSHKVHSVTKSITSAIIGIALRDQYLNDVNQKLLDFFPEFVIEEGSRLDPRKHDITIKHLLTMTAGFNTAYDEYLSPDCDFYIYLWKQSDDWLEYALRISLSYSPGEKFSYISAETHLLSGIISKATRSNTRRYAEKYLFEPLGISIRHWETDTQGLMIGGAGIQMMPRDMARVGYLYLKRGQIDGLQIIPAHWIEESTKTYVKETYKDFFGSPGYGYLWWTANINGYKMYSAVGYGGQHIIVVEDLDMVIVTTAQSRDYREQAISNATHILEFLQEYIISPIIEESIKSGGIF